MFQTQQDGSKKREKDREKVVEGSKAPCGNIGQVQRFIANRRQYGVDEL